jgi:hypothetical protein
MFLLREYSEYRNDNDPAYLGGKAIDAPEGDSIEGTQYDSRFFNQIFGFHQSVIFDAYGKLELSGHPDSIDNPEVLNAFKTIIHKITDELLEKILQNKAAIEGEIATREADYISLLNTINLLTIRLAVVENALYSDIVTNPFEITFNDIDGLIIVTGIWNEQYERIECTLTDDLISISFTAGNNFIVLTGVYNAELDRIEC